MIHLPFNCHDACNVYIVAHRITPEGYGPNNVIATQPHSQTSPKGEYKRKWVAKKLTMLYSYVTFRPKT